jgi:hypothetical protein
MMNTALRTRHAQELLARAERTFDVAVGLVVNDAVGSDLGAWLVSVAARNVAIAQQTLRMRLAIEADVYGVAWALAGDIIKEAEVEASDSGDPL